MEENIRILSKKCKNKKVVFYCIGELFREISKKFNLKEYFNIDSLCDMRFENKEFIDEFLCINPKELKNRIFDTIIIVSPNPNAKEKFLKENYSLSKKIKFLKFYQKKIKINAKKNYKLIEKKLKTKEKLKVLFICEQNQKWCYTDLYKKLQKENRFEILPVILFPIISSGKTIFTQEENKTFLNKLNIDSIDFYDYQNNKNKNIEELKPDIVFYQQPWYLNNINHPKYVSSYALTIMSPYGYTTLSEKNWGDESVKEVYQSLWIFLAESPYHIKFYKKTAKMKDNLKTFGSLKLDNYKKPIQNNIWKKPQNFKIIYAPHHSLFNDGLKMSTFDKDYLNFLNFAKENKQYSFIFKPHPMLKEACAKHGFLNNEEFENYLQEWNNLENANICLDGDYFDIFKTSDILITDCSSFLAEYYPSKKPIIFLNRIDRAPFDKFGNKIKKGFYEINNFNEIEPLIKEIIIKDKLLKTREKILKKEFYIDNKYTFEKVIDFLKLI